MILPTSKKTVVKEFLKRGMAMLLASPIFHLHSELNDGTKLCGGFLFPGGVVE